MEQRNDVLKGKFTTWMEVVIKRAKIDYIRRQNRHSNDVSIEDEDLVDKLICEPTTSIESVDGFCFDNPMLAAVFKKLTPKRKQVLELLYVENMEPEEVAEEMQCTLQHVYNLRSLAIKELKNRLSRGNNAK